MTYKDDYQHWLKTNQKRLEYWNHFVEQYFVDSIGGGNGITGPRLRKIKNSQMVNDQFWYNVIDMHDGQRRTPEQMKAESAGNYEHCLGNFWGMLMQDMVKHGLIKGR